MSVYRGRRWRKRRRKSCPNLTRCRGVFTELFFEEDSVEEDSKDIISCFHPDGCSGFPVSTQTDQRSEGQAPRSSSSSSFWLPRISLNSDADYKIKTVDGEDGQAASPSPALYFTIIIYVASFTTSGKSSRGRTPGRSVPGPNCFEIECCSVRKTV